MSKERRPSHAVEHNQKGRRLRPPQERQRVSRMMLHADVVAVQVGAPPLRGKKASRSIRRVR